MAPQQRSGHSEADEPAEREIEFAWRAHPARESPGRAIAGSGITLLVAGVVAALAAFEGQPLHLVIALGALSAAVIVLALHKFYFPSRFEIDSEGITANHFLSSRRLEWKNMRRFLHDAFGGYLSTRSRRSRLDAWQGMHLLFGGDREAVIREIEQRLSRAREERAQTEAVEADSS